VVAALKAAVVIAVLERLCLTKPTDWLEETCDYYAMQALTWRTRLSFMGQIGTFFRFTKRLSS
jgi:hypothetical protein